MSKEFSCLIVHHVTKLFLSCFAQGHGGRHKRAKRCFKLTFDIIL